MTRLTFLLGAILVLLGVIFYVATGAASLTALIPSAVGALLLGCAAIARRAEWHRHALHAALAIALLAVLGSLMNVFRLGEVLAGTAARPAAAVESTIMVVLLLGYLAAGVRSFLAARRARTREG